MSHFVQGMVDTEGFQKIEAAAGETKSAVENEEWLKATQLWSYTEHVILQVTGNIDFYNILYKVSPGRFRNARKPILPSARDTQDDRDLILDNLMNNDVKKALGVNVTWGAQSGTVFSRLSGDFMKPVTHIGMN